MEDSQDQKGLVQNNFKFRGLKMTWKSYLKVDNMDWLLEDDNPSVKYFTLTTLLDKKEDDREVRKAKDIRRTAGGLCRTPLTERWLHALKQRESPASGLL